jgi:hypothetical protein
MAGGRIARSAVGAEDDMAEVIRFKCPSCETSLRAKAIAAGRIIDCPKCRTRVRIPDPSELQPDEPATAPRDAKVDSRSKKGACKWLVFGVAAVLLLAVGGGLGYYWWNKFSVRECYVLEDVAVLDSEGRSRPDLVALIVRPWPPPTEFQSLTDYKLLTSDGKAFTAETKRWSFSSGGATSVLFAVPRGYLESGGLRVQYQGSSTVSLPSKIDTKTVNDMEKR